MATKTTKTTRTRNGFAAGHRGVFKCGSCGRPTRYTGAQSMSTECCPECYDLAGISNEISDGHCTHAERVTEIAALAKAIAAKGGDAVAALADFPEPPAPAPEPTPEPARKAPKLIAEHDGGCGCGARREFHVVIGLAVNMEARRLESRGEHAGRPYYLAAACQACFADPCEVFAPVPLAFCRRCGFVKDQHQDGGFGATRCREFQA